METVIAIEIIAKATDVLTTIYHQIPQIFLHPFIVQKKKKRKKKLKFRFKAKCYNLKVLKYIQY